MGSVELIQEAIRAGLRLTPEGDRLRIRGPKRAAELAIRLLHDKKEVLAVLRGTTAQADCAIRPVERDASGRVEQPGNPPNAESGGAVVLQPGHPLVDFDWDTSPGYCPGRRIIRNGVEHKTELCTSKRSWQHVWGSRYCLDCWPPTDPTAIVQE